MGAIISDLKVLGLLFYKFVPINFLDAKNSPEGIGCLRGFWKKRLLLSGDSKSLALLGYYYTIQGHHLILHFQNWWTLPLRYSIREASKGSDAFGAPLFCSRHQRVNINENQISFKCSGIKREKEYHKKGPRWHPMPSGPPFSVPDTRGLTIMQIKYASNIQF